jgi:U6 snRNA-associated Sm-like protein LSm6
MVEQSKKTPADFLKMIKGRPVGVRLNDGTEYRGTFICLDGHLNVVLEKCKEYKDEKMLNSFTDIFIRGNNVSYLFPLKNQ